MTDRSGFTLRAATRQGDGRDDVTSHRGVGNVGTVIQFNYLKEGRVDYTRLSFCVNYNNVERLGTGFAGRPLNYKFLIRAK